VCGVHSEQFLHAGSHGHASPAQYLDAIISSRLCDELMRDITERLEKATADSSQIEVAFKIVYRC